jgi:anti-sigma factor RsiW
MSNHLTEEQISNWVIGEIAPAEREHARTCPHCKAEVAAFQSALSEFRSSALSLAEKKSVAIPDTRALQRRSRPFHNYPARWLAVVATVVVLAIVPAYKNSVERRREAQAQQDAKLDAQLLERVNAHLARTTPASLQPLMELLATPQNGKTDNQGENR